MGRTILAEDRLKKNIDALFGQCKLQIGLIIGQLTPQKDFILHLARTPDPVEDEAEIESCQDEEDVPKKQEKKKAKKSPTPVTEEINEKWITEHARQVNRMLPGGLNIIGVYIFSTPDFLNKNQAKLRQCINAVHKMTERNTFIRSALPHNDRILLHICASSRKITCRTMDVSDNQMQLRPAEFKYQNFVQKWNSVKCIADIDLKFHLPVTSEKNRFENLIFQGLQSQLEEIWGSIAAIQGYIVKDDQLLFESTKNAKGKSSKEEPKTADIDLYICSKCDQAATMTKNGSRGVIKFVGKLSSQAHLHAKATKGEAVKALKGDIIRSILSRIQLLCEEAEVNNLYQVDNWSLVSPTRVFANFLDTPIDFCDYVFKDEETKDSLERFSELLNVSLTEDSLLFYEKSPDTEMAAQMSIESGQNSSNEESTDPVAMEEQSNNSNYLVCVIGILVAISASLVAVLMTR